MKNETLKVGDLVETCHMLPGFIVYIDPSDSDEIEVQTIGVNGYKLGHGGCHSVKHCGVHKISNTRAMCLVALGEKKLEEL